MTANCDLVHRKSGGILSYVPIVPVHVYARVFTAPAILEFYRKSAWRSLDDVFRRFDVSASRPRIEEMMALGETAADIVSLISSEEAGASRKDIESALEAVLICSQTELALTVSKDIASAFGDLIVLVERLDVLQRRKARSARDVLRKELMNRLGRLPGDSLFLDNIGRDHADGYVAYLRLIREIDRDRIATSPADERLRANVPFVARRIDRLDLLYTQKLLQQMTSVFTDIGMPETYECRRDEQLLYSVECWLSEEGLSCTNRDLIKD